MDQQYKYMVYVSCMTYNHAPYIKETLDGFCLQQTTFPFVCGVIDDASTDGEQVVLREYMAMHFDLEDDETICCEETADYVMTFARHKENTNCYFAVYYLKYNHFQNGHKPKLPYVKQWRDKSKYNAVCEGDDYWILPNKLQMQVDFMESNPEYVLCHTDFEATEKRRTHYIEKYIDGVYFPSMLNDGFMIGTLTVMYRMTAYNAAPKYYKGKGWPMGDKPLWYELASMGKVKYFPVVSAIYRILPI